MAVIRSPAMRKCANTTANSGLVAMSTAPIAPVVWWKPTFMDAICTANSSAASHSAPHSPFSGRRPIPRHLAHSAMQATPIVKRRNAVVSGGRGDERELDRHRVAAPQGVDDERDGDRAERDRKRHAGISPAGGHRRASAPPGASASLASRRTSCRAGEVGAAYDRSRSTGLSHPRRGRAGKSTCSLTAQAATPRCVLRSPAGRCFHFERTWQVVTSAIRRPSSPVTVVLTMLMLRPRLTYAARASNAPRVWFPARLALRLTASGNPRHALGRVFALQHQRGGGDVRKPECRAGMDRPERVQDPRLNRHLREHVIRAPLPDGELDTAGVMPVGLSLLG